jgi:hypothetical protein
MYALVSGKPFKNEIELKTPIPNFPPIFESNSTMIIPYTREQMLNITAKFACKKNSYNTMCNIYCMEYDVLDTHIGNAFKVAPSTVPPTIG